jgi:hypothetical protein
MFEPKKEHTVNPLLVTVVIILGVLCVLGGGVGAYYFRQYHNLKKDMNGTAKDEEQRIIDKVTGLYSTPKESPSIVQVQDQSKVASQAFFRDAKNGDYVLVYQRAKLAILYRESVNKIINTGPITLPDDVKND